MKKMMSLALANTLALLMWDGLALSTTTEQRVFASPEKAVAALVEVLRAGKQEGLLAVLGAEAASWLYSGDPVADANSRKRFLAAYDEKKKVELQGDAKAVLIVGRDRWPFPAPIVQDASGWTFDTDAGREEILNRRVGRNELDTTQALLAIVDAQREYAATDANHDGFADYADSFRSSTGKKDGLYWPTQPNEPESPLGSVVAEAASEGYRTQIESEKQAPFYGYYYRMLSSQGPDAVGGAYDYTVKGKRLGGFAVIAYPANYGNSGVMTFMVNHEGVVYEKDLGLKGQSDASSMKRFNPDASWKKVGDPHQEE